MKSNAHAKVRSVVKPVDKAGAVAHAAGRLEDRVSAGNSQRSG